MNNTGKITLSAIFAALSAVIMLLAYFPYFTYAVPALAGLAIMVVFIEIGGKWAVASYFASLLPILLICENESKILYLLLFGYYPIVKAVFEKTNKIFAYFLKLLLFNGIIALVYFALPNILGIPLDDIEFLGKYAIPVLIIVANVTFILYDILISKAAGFYIYKLHSTVSKYLMRNK